MTQRKQGTITNQKNPLRVEQGKRLAEYNHNRKKEELKHWNELTTKSDDMVEQTPKESSNNCLYISGVGEKI